MISAGRNLDREGCRALKPTEFSPDDRYIVECPELVQQCDYVVVHRVDCVEGKEFRALPLLTAEKARAIIPDELFQWDDDTFRHSPKATHFLCKSEKNCVTNEQQIILPYAAHIVAIDPNSTSWDLWENQLDLDYFLTVRYNVRK